MDGSVVNHFVFVYEWKFSILYRCSPVSWYLHYANCILLAWFINVCDVSALNLLPAWCAILLAQMTYFIFLYWTVVLLIVNMIWLFMLYKSSSSLLILLLLLQAIYAVICLDASLLIDMRNYLTAYFSKWSTFQVWISWGTSDFALWLYAVDHFLQGFHGFISVYPK